MGDLALWHEKERLYRQACYLEAHLTIEWKKHWKRDEREQRISRIVMKARARVKRRLEAKHAAWPPPR